VCRTRWTRGLRCGSVVSRFMGLWVRSKIVSCECCVLSDRGLCVGVITRPQSPTDCGVSECDRETSIMRRPWPTGGCCAVVKKKYIYIYSVTETTPYPIKASCSLYRQISVNIRELCIPFTSFVRFSNRQQDMHCTYNVTMRRVRATIVVVEKR